MCWLCQDVSRFLRSNLAVVILTVAWNNVNSLTCYQCVSPVNWEHCIFLHATVQNCSTVPKAGPQLHGGQHRLWPVFTVAHDQAGRTLRGFTLPGAFPVRA
ncbi:hypothetical protein quinque_008424 [Culex quinquefasciatus]